MGAGAEKMLNITNQQGNPNHKPNELSPYTYYSDQCRKDKW